MPHVEGQITVQAPRDVVWKLAQDVEKLPDILPDLDSVKIMDRTVLTSATTRVVTDWHGRIKQFNRQMWWTEEDIWNSETFTCHFWQLRGDFSEYRGEYRFVEKDANSTDVHLAIDYKFEIPLIGKMMQKVILKLMQENTQSTLNGLRDEAERQVRMNKI